MGVPAPISAGLILVHSLPFLLISPVGCLMQPQYSVCAYHGDSLVAYARHVLYGKG